MFYCFLNHRDRNVDIGYYLPKVEIKDFDVIIEGQNFFDQSVKSNLRTHDNIMIIPTGQRDDYRTDSLLDYIMLK